MKKKITLVILAVLCMLTLSACGCKHETWNEADCVNPKTCAECGETEGAPLGHSWLAATCETAKTCEVCGTVDGEPLGHSWVDATCEAPKTCTNCHMTEGEALGHTWAEATTEAPKTCTACAVTEGERIITDERFTTAATAEIQGTWICQIDMTGEMMELEGFDGVLTCNLILELGNDGTLTMGFSPADEAQFQQAMLDYLIDTLYAELEASGFNQAEADAAMKETYGMTVSEYAAYALQEMDLGSIFDTMQFNAVYYVEDSELYIGISWDAAMEGSPYTLDGNTLTLDDDVSELGMESLTFTRASE